jgi:uncharacterized alpha/beta hydrolase family protein
MVRWTRTARVRNGKFMEAIAWAKEMAAYGQKKYGVDKIAVFHHSFGDISAIQWSVDYADLATLERVQAQIMLDQDYWKRVASAFSGELFFEGSAHDTVLREV